MLRRMEGNMQPDEMASPEVALRGLRPLHALKHSVGNWESLGSPTGKMAPRAAKGSLRTEAGDERSQAVGWRHSTGEVPERRARSGGDGGKAASHRE